MLQLIRNVESVEVEEVKNLFAWDVVENPIYLGNGQRVQNHKAISRSDNGAVLNVCKESYTPTTNEQFSEFVYNLSKITGYELAKFEEFQEGAKVIAFLNAPETSLNGWKFQNLLAVGNAHDSSKAFFVANTNVMIRCANQFTKLSNNAGMKAFHTSGNANQIRQIENSIHLYDAQQKALMQNFNRLALQPANENRMQNFVRHIFDIDPEITFENAEEKISTRKANQIVDLMDAIEIESNDLGKTDFALFNGVTRWTTHTRTQREKTFGNLFGTNAQLNDKALNFLLN